MKRKEAEEQISIMQWTEYNKGRFPELDLIYHVGNGGSRHVAEAANLKRQGVKPGVPDLVLPVPMCGFAGLYLELKVDKSCKISDNQKKWIEMLREQGYKAGVCYGAEHAIKVIENYVSQPRTKLSVE